MKWKDSKRYYISWSYHCALSAIKEALKDCKVQYVRTSNQFGWRNQPVVVTFRAKPEDSRQIEFIIEKCTVWPNSNGR